MSLRSVATLAFLMASGCVRPVTPLPELPATLAVSPPQNRTGSELVVAGDWILERFALGGRRVTVPDVLAAETQTLLAERGFVLAPPEQADVPALALVIERWEPEAPSLAFVRVTLATTLVERPAGRVLWSARRKDWMVPTRGAPTAAAASTMAARAVVQALYAGWRVRPPAN
jgi:hypothetical protein